MVSWQNHEWALKAEFNFYMSQNIILQGLNRWLSDEECLLVLMENLSSIPNTQVTHNGL